MKISLGLRRLLLGACTALALTPGVDRAQAGNPTITFSDPNCASWTVTGTAPNFTLTCQALACSITASPGASPAPGTAVTLNGACTSTTSNQAGTTTYSWRLVSGDPACPATSANTYNATVSSGVVTPQGCLYQVTGTNPTLGNGSSTVLVNWTNTPPAAPSNCSVAANPTTIPAAGGTVTLTASCTGGGTATSWAWTKNGTAMAGNASTASDTLAANSGATATVTYAVVASNAGGSAASTSVGVVWTGTGGGGGGGGGGPYSCSGFASTLSADMTWSGATPLEVYTSQLGSFGNNVALVIGVTPTAAGGGANYGRLTAVEYGAQKYNRIMTVSTSPCDFQTNPPTLAPLGGSATVGAPDPAVYFTTGGGVQSWWYFDMTPGTKYYINIKNANSNGSQSCPAGTNCSMLIQLFKPAGL